MGDERPISECRDRRPRSVRSRLGSAFRHGTAALLLVLSIASPAAAPGGTSVPTKEGRRAVVEGDLFLRVPVPKKGGLAAVAKKYTGDAAHEKELLRFNRVRKGHRLAEARVPAELLTPAYGRELQQALFPEDARTKEGWEHRFSRGSWSDLARWFTGDAGNAPNLKAANRKLRTLKKGDRVFVPYGLLREPFRRFAVPGEPEPTPRPIVTTPPVAGPAPGGTPPTTAPPPGPGTAPPIGPPVVPAGPAPPLAAAPATDPRSLLTYGKDEKGAYALYRLQPHEALYSAVVVRFTGNVSAPDVNALALEIAQRSGIADVTGIPIGFPVKIPVDELLPQFLPADDIRFVAWQANESRVSEVPKPTHTASLDGVVVILDAGHGGLDRGAVKNGVWEDSYVYDIVCRIHQGLESRTKARVLLTLMEPSLGLKPQEVKILTPNTGAVILTHPWFHQESTAETKVEVNLRWYLANQYYERLVREGTDAGRVVFTSIHADSLHPSLRGTMFYVPGTAYRSSKWSQSGDAYKPFTEYKAKPIYTQTDEEQVRTEGLSRQFSRCLEKAFKDRALALHPFQPTRDHVVRGRRAWVPAVLRNTVVPCSLLVEVCNIANKEDAEMLKDPAYRQAVAEAYIDALIAYYS